MKITSVLTKEPLKITGIGEVSGGHIDGEPVFWMEIPVKNGEEVFRWTINLKTAQSLSRLLLAFFDEVRLVSSKRREIGASND